MKYSLRTYQPTDAQNVVKMLNTNRQNPRAVVDGAGNIRLIRYVPFSSSKVVVEDKQKNVVGYAYVTDKENSFVFETGGGVHPAHWNAGVGSILVEWAKDESTRLIKNAPKSLNALRAVLQINIFETEHEAIKLFENEGFKKVRTWAHYEMELKNEFEISNKIKIREFDLESDDDWELLNPVQDAAFMQHWGAYSFSPNESYALETDETDSESANQIEDEIEPVLDSSYSNTQDYCFIAFINNEVAGGILCNAKLVEFQNTGRVGSVFVHPKFHRKGVGKNLMHAAFNAFYKNGMKRVILDTDSQSFTDSAKFYTSFGMKIYRYEFLYEKEIRAGKEIRRLEK
jgi:GNAT superfamily N-acetyltransferase